jgi:hypothetical protein
MAKLIRITYDITTPESVEQGDYAESGWVDEEGEDMTPDEDDREDGITAVDKAVEFLRDHGATEPSEWTGRGTAAARWWTNTEYDVDYSTGERESRSYHLHGFTEKEKHEIYRQLMR